MNSVVGVLSSSFVEWFMSSPRMDDAEHERTLGALDDLVIHLTPRKICDAIKGLPAPHDEVLINRIRVSTFVLLTLAIEKEGRYILVESAPTEEEFLKNAKRAWEENHGGGGQS